MTAGAPLGLIWIYVLSSALVFIVIGTVIRLVVAVQRKQVEESRRFSQGLVEAQDAERARIARELHDDVIQRVALIGGELSALGRIIPNPSEAVTQRIDGLREELHDLADEVRAMARRTHPAILDHLGLPNALQSLAADLAVSDDLAVTVETDPAADFSAVSPAAALSLFRAAQEGLRNVARHAGVSSATVRVGPRDGGVFVAIEDRGNGMAPSEAAGKGLGLIGLNERFRAVQGQVSIASHPGQGTTLTAWVPRQGGVG